MRLRTVQRVEAGASPSKETLLALAGAFDVDWNQLISIENGRDKLAMQRQSIRRGWLAHFGLWATFALVMLACFPLWDQRFAWGIHPRFLQRTRIGLGPDHPFGLGLGFYCFRRSFPTTAEVS